MNYVKYVIEALYGAVYKILKDIETGKDQDHTMYISFLRNYPGVTIQTYLDGYDDKDVLTIVLENQFWNLSVDYFGFKVTVLLNNQYCDLYIPYKAITIFSDPKKDFLLDFQRNHTIYEELEESSLENPHDPEDIIEVDFNDINN